MDVLHDECAMPTRKSEGAAFIVRILQMGGAAIGEILRLFVVQQVQAINGRVLAVSEPAPTRESAKHAVCCNSVEFAQGSIG